MKKQMVVRTYSSKFYKNGYNTLQHYLSEGYLVVMCNRITTDSTDELEYILEKDVEVLKNVED